MGVEIERKYLVINDDWKKVVGKGITYRQGYLCLDPERTVRIRSTSEGKAEMTVKGLKVGISCPEYNIPIFYADAEEMLDGLCHPTPIDKIRYTTEFGGLVWEIDEYIGYNSGLVIAEVELTNVDSVIQIPSWVGKDVSYDTQYANSMLSRVPFTLWGKAPTPYAKLS